MANDFRVLTFAAEPASTSAGSEYHIYTTPSSTTTIILGLMLTNIHTSQVTAKVLLESDTTGGTGSASQTNNIGAGTGAGANNNTTAVLLNDVPIPVGSTLEVLSGGKIVMQPTDTITVTCSVADKLSGALSIMEIT
tara:strand:+ start:37 stop:447 length:411 start_codon:yes stop_codon:yes gene_type:complete